MLLTDKPKEDADITAVFVTIERVDLTFEDDDREPVTILDEPATFDLYELRNGVTTVLGVTDLPAGEVGQIRLILGDAEAEIDGDLVPLKVPSGEQTGIKLEGPFTVRDGCVVEVTVDFDAD